MYSLYSCVRFLHEIQGEFSFGVIGRGSSMEIGTYIDNFFSGELSGNIIDLCPVGALTSMPFAFVVRPWESKFLNSIDVLDSLASSIRINFSNNAILRILPRLDEGLNEEWLTNKARFGYDSLNNQRLTFPKIKVNINLFLLVD